MGEPTTCTISGCDKPIFNKGKGWCSKHYARWQRHGDPEAAVRRYRRQDGTCTVEGCDEPKNTGDLCGRHYQRARKTGDPGPAERLVGGRTDCSVEGCTRPHHANGYCEGHDGRVRRTGSPGPVEFQKKTKQAPVCSFEGCNEPTRANNFCPGHYRQDAAGQPLRPLKKYAPAGSGYVTKEGYRVLKVDGKDRLEHRLVAEQALGRPLLRTEEVHHLNGDRLGNWTDGPFVLTERGQYASGNLELWSTRQPKGQEIGPKVEWALEILRLYAPQHLA